MPIIAAFAKKNHYYDSRTVQGIGHKAEKFINTLDFLLETRGNISLKMDFSGRFTPEV